MKKDWVAVGVIELVGGALAVIVGSLSLRPHGVHIILLGLGVIFVVIGTVVLVRGLRSDSRKKG